MKLYTTIEQTAKLIELGFEKPKYTFTFKIIEHNDVKTDIDMPVSNYSIGELIEMLPMEDRVGERSMVYDGLEWVVNWDNDDGKINQVVATELIDALYDMVIKLKDDGVI